ILNQSVASRECFSSLAENIRCATKPPPPGSEPGYHVDHQMTETYTRKVIMGIQAELRSGTKLNADPTGPPATALARSTAPSFCFSSSMPPTACTANTASTMTIDIFRTN